jgi:hypothetical protein
MERRIPMGKDRGDALALRQFIRDLEEARSLAMQAERRELAESLGAWMERLERDSRGSSKPSLLSEYPASELWLG